MKRALKALVIAIMMQMVLSDRIDTDTVRQNKYFQPKYSILECAQCIADKDKKIWSYLERPLIEAYWCDKDAHNYLWGK